MLKKCPRHSYENKTEETVNAYGYCCNKCNGDDDVDLKEKKIVSKMTIDEIVELFADTITSLDNKTLYEVYRMLRREYIGRDVKRKEIQRKRIIYKKYMKGNIKYTKPPKRHRR